MKLSFDLMRESANLCRSFLPTRDSQIAWLEFQNKLQTFTLFEYADSLLDLPDGADVPLSVLTAKAAALGPYDAVWATEGIGHYYAERSRSRRGILTDPFKDGGTNTETGGSLIALHAGLGLSFANRMLKTLSARSSAAELRRTVREFFDLCRENSIDGYKGAAYEALGLVVRNLYPHLVSPIDHLLSETDESLAGLFWHGIGRALYFAPTNCLPSGTSFLRAIEMTQREPAHTLGRLNAMAGLIWAATLVNIRHPAIMENFVNTQGSQFSMWDAFYNGMTSSIVVWHDCAGDDSSLSQFYKYRCDSSSPGLVERWDRYVRRAGEDALLNVHPALKRHRRLDEVFRYQSLSELVERLEG